MTKALPNISSDTSTPLETLLFVMKRLRAVEETIAAKYGDWKMRCPVHLSTGQEGVSAGVGLALRKDDFAVSGHRAHTHYLAKGGSLKRMLAEIYGRAPGCSGGRGGSMHLIDESVGFMGSTAIVANSIPIGVGLGLSISLESADRVSVVFLGDGAIEEGVFYESVNFAALKKLPVLFVCENNQYSVYTHLRSRQPAGRRIHEMVAAMGVPSKFGDGNDAPGVYESCREAIASIRRGEGPRFLEYETYRWREHCGPNFDNDLGYRTEQEYLEWRAREPIGKLESRLRVAGAITDARIAEMDREIRAEIADAFAFAENAPFPPHTEAAAHVYEGPRE
jgi:TPP-dependent pyruvate/acetoin dehydrogenase alpha subunit